MSSLPLSVFVDGREFAPGEHDYLEALTPLQLATLPTHKPRPLAQTVSTPRARFVPGRFRVRFLRQQEAAARFLTDLGIDHAPRYWGVRSVDLSAADAAAVAELARGAGLVPFVVNPLERVVS